MENFFFAEILGLCIVAVTELKNASLALLLALVDSLLAILDFFKALTRLSLSLVTISGETMFLERDKRYLLFLFTQTTFFE